MKTTLLVAAGLTLAVSGVWGQEILKAWEFNKDGDAHGWVPAHSLSAFVVSGGTLKTEVTSGDPYMIDESPNSFSLQANDFQYVEIRMRHSGGLAGEFFWSEMVGGKEEGFVAGKERSFPAIPDNQWHVYHVYPLWKGTITRLRLDPPAENDSSGTVEIDYIRIIQGQKGEHDPTSAVWDFTKGNGAWIAMAGGSHLTASPAGTQTEMDAKVLQLVSPPLELKTAPLKYASLQLEASAPLTAHLYWTGTDDANFPGCNAVSFDIPAGPFSSALNLSQNEMYTGDLKRLELVLEGEPGTKVTLRSLVLADKPVGPAHLRLVSFAPEEAVVTTDQGGRLVARVENTGGEEVKEAQLTVTGGEARARLRGAATRAVAHLAPGAATEVQFGFSPRSEGWAAFSLEGPDGIRAHTDVLITRPFPTPRATEQPQAQVSGPVAWIGNDKVLLTVVQGPEGFGPGRLECVEAGKARPMGTLPQLAAVQLAGGSLVELACAQATARQAANAATLTFTGTPTVAGAKIALTVVITLSKGKPYLDVSYELSADRDLKVAAFRGPWLWAGEGAFGDQQDVALFPGVEYLTAGERSSSTLDVAPPMNVRWAPHPNTITVPSMAIERAGATVGLMWDPLQKWDGEHDRPTAVFASPNFVEGRANHLLGLCLPAIPDWLKPNQLVAEKPYELAAGKKLTLCACLWAEAKSEVLRSMDLYCDRYGLPDLPPRPRSYEDDVAMCLKAYDTVLWDEKAQGWHGVLQWAAGRDPGVALEYYLLASRLLQDKAWAAKLQAKGLALAAPGDLAASLHQFGRPWAALRRLVVQARGQAVQAPADGKYSFHPDKTTRSLGADGALASGIAARGVRDLLVNALRTGDPKAAQAGLKTLKFMEQFRVPRASQVWECPVHAPDILASGDCCEVYTLGYRLTGDPELLKRAAYWAKTGLPFVYLWQARDQKPFMKGATIPIFGGSFYVGSWFARAVQWNGLAYASALLELSKYDQSLPWKHFAEMITLSGMNQQSTRPADYGCYTDNWGTIDGAECVGCMLSPGGILNNVLDLLGAPHGVQTQIVGDKDKRLVINSAPLISAAKLQDGILQFSLAYDAGCTAYTTVLPLAEPVQVEVDGTELTQRPTLTDLPEAWAYDPALGCLTLKLRYGQGPREVRITKATPIALEPGVPAWTFNTDGDAQDWEALHDVKPLTVTGGRLVVEVTGGDAYIGSPPVAVEAAEHPGVIFRARATAPDGVVYFASQNGGFSPARYRAFQLPADGQFHEVKVDLSDHPEWKGLITQIRLDFHPAPCTAEIGWVRFLDKPKGKP